MKLLEVEALGYLLDAASGDPDCLVRYISGSWILSRATPSRPCTRFYILEVLSRPLRFKGVQVREWDSMSTWGIQYATIGLMDQYD
jgi:hypothetical protein